MSEENLHVVTDSYAAMQRIGIYPELAEQISVDLNAEDLGQAERMKRWSYLLLRSAQLAINPEDQETTDVPTNSFVQYLRDTLQPDENSNVEYLVRSFDAVGNNMWSDDGTEPLLYWDVGYVTAKIMWQWTIEKKSVELNASIDDIQKLGPQATSEDWQKCVEIIEELDAADRDLWRFKLGDEYEGVPDSRHTEIRVKAKFHSEVEAAMELTEKPNTTEVLRFGAKAANLRYIDEIIKNMRLAGSDFAENFFEVPPFVNVEASVFEAWQQGEDIDGYAQEVYSWMLSQGNTNFVVRSSAVHSEDGEHMGAGVYDSVLVPTGSDFVVLRAAMDRVYGSTNLASAREYRESNGIICQESMGLVVQVATNEALEYSTLLTVDSQMAGVSGLARYVLHENSHPLLADQTEVRKQRVLSLVREGIFWDLGYDGNREANVGPIYHVPIDIYVHRPVEVWAAAQVAGFLEKIFGRQVQAEAIYTSGKKLQILQARPLPTSMLQNEKFSGFPELPADELYFSGGAVGVYDGVSATTVDRHTLGYRLSNNKVPEGYVVLPFEEGSFASGVMVENYSRLIRKIPKEQRSKIICVIMRPPVYGDSGGGHLETRLAEMGVGLLFCDTGRPQRNRELVDGQKVRVFANGERGMLYSTDQDPAWKQKIKDRQIARELEVTWLGDVEDM